VVALLGSLGEESEEATFENLAGVNCVQQFETRYELSSRAYKSEDSRVSVGNIEIGGNRFIVAAGPCTVENKEGLSATAEGVVAAGASIIRGGAFKSRTSPFNFQGMGKSGLELLFQVSRHIGVPFVTEVVDPKGVDLISKYADMLQVGSRNMQNSALLTAIGRSGKPVLLKRGFANTIGEWLAAADYILAEGNNKVVLCERGIRTFEDDTRFSLDLSSVPVVKHLSHLPIMVDPSHAAGRAIYVPALAKAALASGADGLLLEVYYDPSLAHVDGQQSLSLEQFNSLMPELKAIALAMGRTV
jgi:3-deoxy-7-phosphoheptulonate synthase